jgi:hypothetical protein
MIIDVHGHFVATEVLERLRRVGDFDAVRSVRDAQLGPEATQAILVRTPRHCSG